MRAAIDVRESRTSRTGYSPALRLQNRGSHCGKCDVVNQQRARLNAPRHPRMRTQPGSRDLFRGSEAFRMSGEKAYMRRRHAAATRRATARAITLRKLERRIENRARIGPASAAPSAYRKTWKRPVECVNAGGCPIGSLIKLRTQPFRTRRLYPSTNTASNLRNARARPAQAAA